MAEQLDRLTSQLNHLPSIIGNLGLSIAAAQKELNADYIESIKQLMRLYAETVGAPPAGGAAAGAAAKPAYLELLQATAPARYQFSETTIEFSADLSESMRLKADAGIGIGTSAVVVNAAMALGFGYDYRAAARITSVLRASPVGAEFAKSLGGLAQNAAGGVQLPGPVAGGVDAQISEGMKTIYKALQDGVKP